MEYRLLQLKRRGESIGIFTIVDSDTYDELAQFNWGLSPEGYVRGQVNKKQILLHRYLMGCLPKDGYTVDHINHDILDNRISNLRKYKGPVQNLQNTSSARNSSSKYRGVCWDKQTGKWKAYGQLGRKKYSLGRFSSEEDAARCSSDWRRENMPYSIEGVD